MYGEISPFRDNDMHSFLRGEIDEVINNINYFDKERILKSSPTELEDYFVKNVIIDPIELDLEKVLIENETNIEINVGNRTNIFILPEENPVVKGTSLEISIPFTGNKTLWNIQPSSYSLSGYPKIRIDDTKITFFIEFMDVDVAVNSDKLQSQYDSKIKSLSNAVQTIRNDIDKHNKSAPAEIKSVLEGKLKEAHSINNAIEKLGIPLKRRDTPLNFIVPIKRRKLPVPQVATESFQKEPELELEEYEHILNICRSMSLVIERNPISFAKLDEETIRTHFLIQLNGHYEGNATGETFNNNGKTDILIGVDNKNVFIAECKFWHGKKSFNDAITQLLGYLSWRDSKCALFVFNRNKNSTDVIEKMHEVIEEREGYKRTLFHNTESGSRYIFVKKDDPGKDVIITTELFDVPKN